ncbi:hypothetical protein GWI33_016935 [Rhynchophorus ferrugineus]|uniref:Uncharacterized protein n=1 Tax=Rhynchophorus ferrugineus TaxID=354439 RepID=A0A834HWH9_RHYFE|nr:hypothetical protein GWI33_016935 [Rhynchophorus ferrugineus]
MTNDRGPLSEMMTGTRAEGGGGGGGRRGEVDDYDDDVEGPVLEGGGGIDEKGKKTVGSVRFFVSIGDDVRFDVVVPPSSFGPILVENWK